MSVYTCIYPFVFCRVDIAPACPQRQYPRSARIPFLISFLFSSLLFSSPRNIFPFYIFYIQYFPGALHPNGGLRFTLSTRTNPRVCTQPHSNTHHRHRRRRSNHHHQRRRPLSTQQAVRPGNSALPVNTTLNGVRNCAPSISGLETNGWKET